MASRISNQAWSKSLNVNCNRRTPICRCSLFSKKNLITRMSCVTGCLPVPNNPYKWCSTVLLQNLAQYHFVDHRSHMDWPGKKHGHLRWHVGHGTVFEDRSEYTYVEYKVYKCRRPTRYTLFFINIFYLNYPRHQFYWPTNVIIIIIIFINCNWVVTRWQ